MLGIVEREIDQSIVDKIDRLSLGQQSAVLVAKLSSIGNRRVDSVLLEEALGQEKLRIKILLCRPIIDNRDQFRHGSPLL